LPVHVTRPGLLTTIQDLGRYHYAHLGISVTGAADRLACLIANRILGNQKNRPVLEMTLTGATLEFDEPALIVLTGARCDCSIGSRFVSLAQPTEVDPGETVLCGNITGGSRTYLAVQGGFEVSRVMESASTHLGGRFGGIQGRSLRAGDILHIERNPAAPVRKVDLARLESLYAPAPIRLTRGAQYHWFGAIHFEAFLSASYSVSEHSNRAGVRLDGPVVQRERHSQLLTEGTSLGAIQVPQDGQPIILYVDQQTTGGYPKIANVIAADMHRIAQLRPRQEVTFEEVSIPDAISYFREQRRYLSSIFVD
jgi:antagonist of KipI